MKKKMMIIIVFAIGMSIFFYPIVSNIIFTREHHTIITTYNKQVEQLKKEQLLKEEEEKVAQYNTSLSESPSLAITDPFTDADSPNNKKNQSYYDALNVGNVIASIHIPKIDAELPIYHGTSIEVLSKGVGHFEKSSLPSSELGTHTVLTAHRGLPSAKMFRELDDLNIGDPFYINVLDQTLTYEVTDINVVLPNETDWLTIESNKNMATLLTCDPYMINTHRLLVTGHLVSNHTENKADITSKQEMPKQNDSYMKKILVICSIVFSCIILLIWRYRKRRKKVDNE